MVQLLDPLFILVPGIACLIVHLTHGKHALTEAFVALLVPDGSAGAPPSSGVAEVCANNPLHRLDWFQAGFAVCGECLPGVGLV